MRIFFFIHLCLHDGAIHTLSCLVLSHMMFIAQKTRVSDAWVKPTFAVDRYGAFDAQHSDALWIAAFRVNQDPHIQPRPDQPASCMSFPQHRSQWTGPDTCSTFLTLSHMMFIAQKTRVSDAWVKPTFAVDRYGAFDAQHSDALWIAAFQVNQDPHIRPRPDQPASCMSFSSAQESMDWARYIQYFPHITSPQHIHTPQGDTHHHPHHPLLLLPLPLEMDEFTDEEMRDESSSSSTRCSNTSEPGGLDLRPYQLHNKRMTHFCLTVDKTLRLKRRKLRGFLCEVLLPPIFICCLMIGYFASDNTPHEAAEYIENPYVNVSQMLEQVFCTSGFEVEADNTSSILRCEHHRYISCIPMWVKEDDSSALCLNVSLAANATNLHHYFHNLYKAVVWTTHKGMAVPEFDSMVVLQRMAKMARGDLRFNVDTYWNSLLHSGSIEIVSEDCEVGAELYNHLAKKTKFFSYINAAPFNRSYNDNNKTENCNKIWRTENDAINYIKKDGADRVWALLVLNRIDKESKVFDYTIRMNYTSTPYTKITHDKFQQGLGKKRARQYINSGFATLQLEIDGFYLGHPELPQHSMISIPMPTGHYIHSQFLEHAGNLIPLVLALSFLYPVSCLVGGVVEEKEQRLREGMLIMGLSKTSFYASWYVSYFIMLTVSSVLITLVSRLTFLGSTSPALFFLLTLCYAMSTIAFALLLSVFFSKSRIATIVSPLASFLMAVPKFTIPVHSQLSTHVAASFSSAVAFGYGTELITNYEKRGSGSDFSDFFSDEYSYALAVWMMLLDTALYLLLAWYLDNVLPSQFGVKLHPLFFLFPSYWGIAKTGKYGLNDDDSSRDVPSRLPQYVDTEIDETTRVELSSRERVRIMGLRIEFPSTEGREKNIAVNNLGNCVPSSAPGGANALTFYEGQVQCVLGHNGAGKTTLINMLTGMLTPTSGDCLIWGKSIRTDMAKIRENIGMCPQHNILWARMSCEEHLTFYGRIKGVPKAVLAERVEQMLKLVNLYEKKHSWSEVLSGGQKRKLSVACSLIGGSKLVFLDEPTAGMDVESRRAMWALLRNPAVLKGRVIVLTTHYMEEADILGDSVAIMHKGCLHSWGSSFYLKSRLGVGYNMSVAMQTQCDPDTIEALVKKYITRAEVGRTSCTGNELRLRLPMDSKPDVHWADIATKKLSLRCESPSKLREKVMELLEQNPNCTQRADYEGLLSNIRTVSVFPDMFDELETRKKELFVEGFGVGVTTLEEVFMRIALEEEEAEGHDTSFAESRSESALSLSDMDLEMDEHEAQAHPLNPADGECHMPPPPTDASPQFGDLYTITNTDDPPIVGTLLYMEQFKGLFMKRLRSSLRDKRTITFQFILPVVFILIALLLGLIGPPSMPLITLNPHLFAGKDTTLAYTVDQRLEQAGLFDSDYMPGYSLYDVNEGEALDGERIFEDFANYQDYYTNRLNLNRTSPAFEEFEEFAELSRYLYNTTDARRKEIVRDIAMSMLDLNGTVHPVIYDNATFIHGLPIGINTLNKALLLRDNANADVHPDLIVRNHPFPFSEYAEQIISEVQITITGIFIMIPFTFIPSNFVSFIVKERECKAKHVQVVSGVYLSAYWLSAFLFDLLAYCVTVGLAFTVFFLSNRTEFIGSTEVFCASLLLFLEYGVAAILSSYMFSFLFNSHTAAQNAVMAFNFIAGFILVIVTQVLDYVKSTKEINPTLKMIYRLVPSYCLGEGIIRLSVRELAETVHYTALSSGPFDMETTGYPLLYMAATTPAFLILTLLIESPTSQLFFKKAKRWVHAQCTTLYHTAQRLFLRAVWRKVSGICIAYDSDSSGGFEERHLLDSDSDSDSDSEAKAATIVRTRSLEDCPPLPRDGPEVRHRRGAWLLCRDEGDGRTYYFNEVTGESKHSDKDTPFYRDQEVQKHADEILSTDHGREGDYVTVKALRKVWGARGNAKRKVAVADVSFGVKKGELFAFLGTNGAGKTTTLSVLSGEVEPSSGQAFIAGHDVVEDAQLARQNLGFCPQFDALLDHLTCEEHLDMFACLRGIPKQHRKSSASILLNGLGLATHRKKLASNLSGGNRRKLSVAVALMGGPSVVFLDEPSAGMDPLARRSLWGALEKAITDLKLSVILTTHHLEEIEGLSRLDHRVTIMVDGRLQCLGSLSQLKNQLGDAFELTLKVKTVEAELATKAYIKSMWPNSELVESVQQRLSYQVDKREASLSTMFRVIEESREKLGIVSTQQTTFTSHHILQNLFM